MSDKPRVGVVFVSHSRLIAEGLVELAGQMAPSTVLVAAGGSEDGRIGTSFDAVAAGITQADGGAGVVILCDLGSAILTAETARDFLDDETKERVLIVDAPLVEGGVAAAVTAETGGDLAAVAAAARTASGATTPVPEAAEATETRANEGLEAVIDQRAAHTVTRTVTLINKDGLHARPAADFVKLATTFDAPVRVNGTDAKSLLGIMALGLVKGASVEISGTGENAQEAVNALADLVESGFGEV